MLPIRPYYANMSTYRSTFHIVHKITMGYLSVFITVNLCVRFCILTFDILTGQCSSSQFWCSVTGECISILGLCDGINTCSDGSDESNSVCCTGRYYFQCTSGECIPSYRRCDGVTRCSTFNASPLLAVAMEFEIALMAVMRLDVVALVSHLGLVSFPDYFTHVEGKIVWEWDWLGIGEMSMGVILNKAWHGHLGLVEFKSEDIGRRHAVEVA